jgi:hypothetical protein
MTDPVRKHVDGLAAHARWMVSSGQFRGTAAEYLRFQHETPVRNAALRIVEGEDMGEQMPPSVIVHGSWLRDLRRTIDGSADAATRTAALGYLDELIGGGRTIEPPAPPDPAAALRAELLAVADEIDNRADATGDYRSAMAALRDGAMHLRALAGAGEDGR